MTTTQRAVSTALALGALLGVHGSACAAATTVHASICVAEDIIPATDLARGIDGLTNKSSETAYIACPIVRSKEPSAAGMHAFVSGFVPNGSTLWCTLLTAKKSGGGTGHSFNFTGPGTFQLGNFLSQAEMPWQSVQSVECSLPPNAQLFNITVIL